MRCTWCGLEFEPDERTHRVVPFCGSWCEQSWWMPATSGAEYERLLKGGE